MSRNPEPTQSPEPDNTPGPAASGKDDRGGSTPKDRPSTSKDRSPTPKNRPSTIQPRRRSTRTGAVWASTTISIVVLILLIIFILQNSGPVSIVFFGFEGSIPLGMALLIAAVAGAAVVAIAGVARLAQVRLNERRARKQQS